jgi:TIR domain
MTSTLSEKPFSNYVFLSYVSDDEEPARAIRVALAEKVDVFDKHALMPGERWQTVIENRIESCSAFIPVVSPQTLTESPRFFRKEWRHAAARSRLLHSTREWLMPVILGGVSPADERIPEARQRIPEPVGARSRDPDRAEHHAAGPMAPLTRPVTWVAKFEGT